MANLLEVTEQNYQEVIHDDKTVVIDFWAEWCGACNMLTPIMEQLQEQYSNKAVIGKLDVATNPALTVKYGIRNIPALLFFKNGELVDKLVGFQDKKTLEKKLEKYM